VINEETLARAVAVAMTAHQGQTDKAGQPYALHVMRVMLAVAEVKPALPTEALVAAVLHDVVEDTEVTIEQIEREFGEEVAALVALLTKTPHEPNDLYYGRLKTNPIAATVKIADLRDNMNMKRLPDPTAKDWERYGRYWIREQELAAYLFQK
jgi:guanosine-3',5'-bis(diphosphate) 3'-pyrophosphohydrolase